MSKKKPRILIVLDQGRVWEVYSDIDLVFIVKNLDHQSIGRLSVRIGDKELDEVEEIVRILNENKDMVEKKKRVK